MDHMVELDIEQYLEKGKLIVKETCKRDLSDEQLTVLTKDILLALNIYGGDFADANIVEMTKQYMRSGGIERCLKI